MLGTIINSCVYVCVYVVGYIVSSLLIDVFCGNNETSWELVCVCWVGLGWVKSHAMVRFAILNFSRADILVC